VKSALHFAGRSPGRIRHRRPSTRTRFPVGLGIALILLSGLACAGGPLKVAGITGFNAGTAGVPLAWPEGLVHYYTDQGNLSPLLLQNDANSFGADAFTLWTNVSTAALSATRAGQLDEDVSGLNVSVDADFQITLPLDIQPSALDKPIAIVFDADGQVTDALLGAGAGGSDLCSTNSVYGGPDNYSLDAHLAHALIVINGNCAQTAGDLPILKYKLVRVLGRVLGLDWSDLNENVFNGSPLPTPDDFAGFPLMHALEPGCAPQCLAPATSRRWTTVLPFQGCIRSPARTLPHFQASRFFLTIRRGFMGQSFFQAQPVFPIKACKA